MINEYIAFYIGSLISIFAFLISYKKIVNEPLDLSMLKIIILICGSLITTILNYYDNPLLKTLYTFIFFIFIFKYKTPRSIKQVFYYSLIIWIYAIAIDFFNMLIVSITKISEFVEMLYVRTGATLIMSTLLFLFCSIPFIQKFTNKTIEKIEKINVSIAMDLIIILFMIIFSVVCFVNIERLTLTIFTVFAAILLILFTFIILSKNYNIKRLKEVNNILIKNSEFFIKLDTDYRVLKHNLTNQLLGIKSVADKNVSKLIDDLIINYNSSFISSKDINKIPKGIHGIIYEKFYAYNNEDIKLIVENNIKNELLEVLSARTFNNFCEYIGVAIDNALDAACTSIDKAILIDFTESKKHIKAVISNTFNNEIDIDRLGNKNYTTKGQKHGIGLFGLFRKKAVKIKTKIINNMFQVELTIKKL